MRVDELRSNGFQRENIEKQHFARIARSESYMIVTLRYESLSNGGAMGYRVRPGVACKAPPGALCAGAGDRVAARRERERWHDGDVEQKSEAGRLQFARRAHHGD